MSGACSKSRVFFERATPEQFEWVLAQYDAALSAKAHKKSSKPDNIIKLDKWYQNELPKKIKGRGKDAHLTHDELVQTIKWKLARGKFRPNLTNLVQMNTPRVVVQETKKAFRNLFKRGDLQAAATALCNLKGVGPGMASAVLAAGAPHLAPFMADECLLAMPDTDSLDYTMKEYMKFVEMVNGCVERLNNQQAGSKWTPHKVELAVWTYYILNDLKPEKLSGMVGGDEFSVGQPQQHHQENSNGAQSNQNFEDSNPASSMDESSNPAQDESSNMAQDESSNMAQDETSNMAQDESSNFSQQDEDSQNPSENGDSKNNNGQNGQSEDDDSRSNGVQKSSQDSKVVAENGSASNNGVQEEDSSSMPGAPSEDPSSEQAAEETKKRSNEDESQADNPPEKKAKTTSEGQQEAIATA